MLRISPPRPADAALQAPRASSLRGRAGTRDRAEVDRVYREIFDAAMDRRLLPGARLTEARLCDIFNCSRGTVRAALAELAHDRIVSLAPNRGATVWQASRKEIHEVFTLRRWLECVVIDQLVQLDDLPARLQPLHDMVEREQQAFEQGDRISWLRLSNAFHVALARLLGNQELSDLLASLCARTTLIIALGDQAEDSTCSYHEHRDLLASLEARDAARARSAMHLHLLDCEQRVDDAPPRTADPWAAFGPGR
ncbi:GntR family transcriptional regulator [Castellaniella sp.]|uniref:GntR family transcriptional regulator n=1 Tax=Castellaniella sp. TaxID=1955812 RepID=UPI003560AEC7